MIRIAKVILMTILQSLLFIQCVQKKEGIVTYYEL